MTQPTQEQENKAVSQLKLLVEAYLESPEVSLCLDENGLIDTPQEFWAIARALGDIGRQVLRVGRQISRNVGLVPAFVQNERCALMRQLKSSRIP